MACNKAFALACWYSGGHDLVEEMVASKCWSLGKNIPAMTIEIVRLPMFGDEEGIPFSRFNNERVANESAEEFVHLVEEEAHLIVGDISDVSTLCGSLQRA